MSTEITKHKVTMRSKTTYGTDTQVIEVHPGQDVREVADRIAEGYGATVEEVVAIPAEYKVTMRCKSPAGTHTEVIEVHPGQDAREVADRIAAGYGATVEEVVAV